MRARSTVISRNLDFPRPLTTVDVAIFTVLDQKLRVLLVQRPNADTEPFPGYWALPGGFVDIAQDDSLKACALRKLFEKTGIRSSYLEQLGSWGSATRDPRYWSSTHAYFALIPGAHLALVSGGNAADVKWHETDALHARARLAFDHRAILQTALERLRSKVEYTSLPAFLLPETFTLPQLQKMYEIILARPVDKSGFRTRALAAAFLEETGTMNVGAPRPAMGYRLKDKDRPVYFPRSLSTRSQGD